MMKTALVFTAACALLCTAFAVPLKFERKDVSAEDVDLLRNLIDRTMQSQDATETSAQIQWFSQLLNKAKQLAINNAKDYLRKTANDLLNSPSNQEALQAEVQSGEEADEQDDELLHKLIDMQSQDATKTSAQIQWFSQLLNKAKNIALNNAKDYLRKTASDLLNSPSNQEVKDQHSFHFYDKDQQKAKDQHSFHFYQKALQDQQQDAKDQHSFHFYDKATKKQQDDVSEQKDVAEMEGRDLEDVDNLVVAVEGLNRRQRRLYKKAQKMLKKLRSG